MTAQSLRLLVLPLALGAVLLLLVVIRPAAAASPDNPPGYTPPALAQTNGGISLEKKAISDTVPLGHVVTFTVTINNSGKETINATLSDVLPPLPDGLALQTHSLTATTGTFNTDDALKNIVSWSGSIANGKKVVIHYSVIPPTTSEPNRTLTNVAQLTFGSTTLEASASITTTAPDLGLWGTFVNFIALALVYIDTWLVRFHVPYAFGFAIILFTVGVRLLTYPLNMQQIKSSKAMQELQPRMKELQEKYKNDKEKLAQAQMALYKEAGVNPLGGCLPMLVQMPVWFALYQALVQLSNEGLLNEGFFWLPSLAGPVTYAPDGGLSWLWPLPPIVGWPDAVAYLILPVLLVVSQFYMQQMMTPTSSDPQQASMNSMMKIMPLMFGYFSLVVPSGLTLYWFTTNLLAMAQQYFTQTNLKPATAAAGAALTAPASSQVTPKLEENLENDAKAKRKPRRKR